MCAWLAIGFLWCACASSADEHRPDEAPTYDYGGPRNPFPVEKAQPVVPPPAAQSIAPAPEAPKVDPCSRPCAAYRSSDARCDQLADACDRMYQAQGHMSGETCVKKEKACAEVARLKSSLGSCACE